MLVLGWVRRFSSQSILLPRELKFLRGLVVGDADPTLMTSTSVALMLSYFLHMPTPYGPGLYSDIVSQYQQPHNSLATVMSTSSQLPVVNVIIYVLGVLADNFGGLLTFYTLNSLIIGYALIQATQDIYALLRRWGWDPKPLYILPSSLTLIIYGIYSWTALALALTLRAGRMVVEGEDLLAAAVLMGGAELINPFTFFFYFPMLRFGEARDRFFSIVSYFVTIAMILTPMAFLDISLPLDALNNFFSNYIEGSWLILLMDGNSPYRFLLTPILTAGLVVLSIAYLRVLGEEWMFTGGLVFTSLALFSSYVYKPQFTLLVYPALLAVPYSSKLWSVFVDVLNGGVIIFWWSYKSIEKALFKYSPTSPLEPYALPTALAILRDFILFLIMVSIIVRVWTGNTNIYKQNL